VLPDKVVLMSILYQSSPSFTMAPLVSVLLPFYQADDHLLYNSIESIVKQSFRDWELLLVSNNAGESSLAIAHYWCSQDRRIRLIYEHKQGIAWALNSGIRNARADIIARMDADDVALPDKFEKQYGVLMEHPGLDVVATQTAFASAGVPNSEGYKQYVDWQNSIITPSQHYINRFRESPVAHPTVMFRKQLVERFGLYSTAAIPEDYELWLRWMDYGVRFCKIPEPLLIWNDHPHRLSRGHANYSVEAFYRVKSWYLSWWLRHHVPDDKKIIVCGTSRQCIERAEMLIAYGISIYGYTDVRLRKMQQHRFIKHELLEPSSHFLINFISQRGTGDKIREYFSANNFKEPGNFILAA
jgi:glycosyltransferase involved in cell wall biosynthesis